MNNSEEKVGVLKEIDPLGRLVIPKEFRQRFKLENTVEVVLTEKGILVRNPKFELSKIDETK